MQVWLYWRAEDRAVERGPHGLAPMSWRDSWLIFRLLRTLDICVKGQQWGMEHVFLFLTFLFLFFIKRIQLQKKC